MEDIAVEDGSTICSSPSSQQQNQLLLLETGSSLTSIPSVTLHATQSKQVRETEDAIDEQSNKKMALDEQVHVDEIQRTSRKQEREAYVEWMRCIIDELNPSLWRLCQREMTLMLYRYQDQNEEFHTLNGSHDCA